MQNIRYYAVTLAILFVFASEPDAQFLYGVKYSAFAAVAAPVLDFSDDPVEHSGNRGGDARTGFGLTGELSKPVWRDGVSWTSDLSVLYHPMDDDDSPAVQDDPGSWWVFPLLTGLKYQRTLPNNYNLEWYGLFQVGMAVAKPTENRRTIANQTHVDDVDAEFHFGVGLGAGLVLNQRLNAGLRYHYLGEAEYNLTTRNPTGTALSNRDITLGLFMLMFGYNF